VEAAPSGLEVFPLGKPGQRGGVSLSCWKPPSFLGELIELLLNLFSLEPKWLLI
jgi:hypothetical protein